MSIVRATGQLVTRKDKRSRNEMPDRPDLHATMLRIVDDHARTSAEGFRWRMIHGALSASNMEWSGAMLDLPTQSFQPRTAPVRSLSYADSAFGTEHFERARRLNTVYQALVRSIPAADRQQLNIRPLDIGFEMRAAYEQHLQVKLLSAVGLKTALAKRLQEDQPESASRFHRPDSRAGRPENPGTIETSKSAVETVSVVDVFHLLQEFPPVYFAQPKRDHTEQIRELLRPIFKGNRFHIAKKRLLLDALSKQFADQYGEIMRAGADYAAEYYDDLRSMEASIAARWLLRMSQSTIFTPSGCGGTSRGDRRLSLLGQRRDCARSPGPAGSQGRFAAVDGLLSQGQSRRLEGGLELEMRTIAGVNYSVRAWNDPAQTRRLHLSIPIEPAGHRLPDGGARPASSDQGAGCLASLSLYDRRREDLRRSLGSPRATRRRRFDHRLPRLAGIESVWSSRRRFLLRGKQPSGRENAKRRGSARYVFAIPDRQELIGMASA